MKSELLEKSKKYLLANKDKKRDKRPYPRGFRIEFPGIIPLLELSQCLWQNIHKLEARGVKYVKNGSLFVPITNEYGEPLILKNEDGSRPHYWVSHGYDSAAHEYDL